MASPWDGLLNVWGKAMENNYEVGQNRSTRKVLSDEAINKLIYDALSSDQGLAALASGENLSGGSKSSSKTLLAQDMMTKLIGELAAVTAETQQIDFTKKTTHEGRSLEKATGSNLGEGLSVICTELVRQGLLSNELYTQVGGPYKQVSYFTWRGYYLWATKVASWMQKSSVLSKALLPVVQSRYLLLSGQPGIHFLGRLTQLGEIPCWILGIIVAHVAHFRGLKNVKLQQRT